MRKRREEEEGKVRRAALSLHGCVSVCVRVSGREWVRVQASSAVVPGKDQASRGNNNRQIAKMYTYIPIHERIHTAGGTLQTVLAEMERE